MSYRGIGLLEKEGVIIRIELFNNAPGKIRVIVKSSDEGRGNWNFHAMLNVEDDLFVSLERYHSIITTFQELSDNLNIEVNSQNMYSLYGTKVLFSRYATDINSILREVATLTNQHRKPRSLTINRMKLRVDYDWIYISALNLPGGDDNLNNYRKQIVDYLKNNIGIKYRIGNFRSLAMKLTTITEDESDCVREKNKFARWIIHSPKKLFGHERFYRCTEYYFAYDYEIIADEAFINHRHLEYMTMPDSIKYVGNETFNGCNNLISISLSQSLKSIGTRCFVNCHSLKSIVIPNSVTVIESQAFMNCEYLKEVVMSDNLKHLGWDVFEGCSNNIKILINQKSEEELRKVLFAYADKIVVLDDEDINQKRAYD